MKGEYLRPTRPCRVREKMTEAEQQARREQVKRWDSWSVSWRIDACYTDENGHWMCNVHVCNGKKDLQDRKISAKTITFSTMSEVEACVVSGHLWKVACHLYIHRLFEWGKDRVSAYMLHSRARCHVYRHHQHALFWYIKQQWRGTLELFNHLCFMLHVCPQVNTLQKK